MQQGRANAVALTINITAKVKLFIYRSRAGDCARCGSRIYIKQCFLSRNTLESRMVCALLRL